MQVKVYTHVYKGVEITVHSKVMLEHILGDKIQLAKQRGAISTLIGDSSVNSHRQRNPHFPTYRGVVIQAPQEWVSLPDHPTLGE
jgi:hypothetical protein